MHIFKILSFFTSNSKNGINLFRSFSPLCLGVAKARPTRGQGGGAQMSCRLFGLKFFWIVRLMTWVSSTNFKSQPWLLAFLIIFFRLKSLVWHSTFLHSGTSQLIWIGMTVKTTKMSWKDFWTWESKDFFPIFLKLFQISSKAKWPWKILPTFCKRLHKV